jgi:hypothetical protein
MPSKPLSSDQAARIAALAAACRYDPLRWAQIAFPWGQPGTVLEREALRTWQAETLAMIRDHLVDPTTRHTPFRLAIASGHGIGKAQPLDMILDTPDGLRRWGDLQVGDRLFGVAGPVTITHVHPVMHRHTVEVLIEDGTVVRCDPDHLWTVQPERRRGEAPWQTLTTRELAQEFARASASVAGVRAPRFLLPPVTRPLGYVRAHEEPAISPYVLGWWLAAGITGTGRIGGLTAAQAEALALHVPGERVEARETDGDRWQLHVPGLLATLRKYDLLAPEKRRQGIPRAWATQPPSWRHRLLLGLLDAAAGPVKGRAVFRLTDPGLVASVRDLVHGLCGRVTLTPGGRLSITMPPRVASFTDRRQDSLSYPEPQDLSRRIVGVRVAKPTDVRCVTVSDPSGLYLTEGYVPTHNSAAMSIIGNWALSCHRRARVLVTANTESQLRTKTSPEFAKWARLSITAPLLDVDTMRIAVNDPSCRDNWRLDFVSWSEHNTEAFQGLHNKGSLLAVLVDEGSAIADNVFDVIEGAMTDKDTILLQVVFGNPTRNEGRFREFWRRFRHQWRTRQIDSRTVEGVNTAELEKWVQTYGEDSDFVRVRVRGLFPRASNRQFIPEDLVDAAAGRHLRPEQYEFAPVILSCDPAWTGDDELVIGMRQGLMFRILDAFRDHGSGHAADVFIAQRLAYYEQRYNAQAVFIDAGYGTGIKSAGDAMGRSWQLVWFAGKSSIPGYLNKRAEIWKLTRDWLEMGGAIPDDPVLRQDLIGPQTLARLDGLVALESKEDMRRRGVPSPNRGDALALTFAAPVALPASRGYGADRAKPVILDYTFNPLEG